MSETITITTQLVQGMCGKKFLARIHVSGYSEHPLHRGEYYAPSPEEAEASAEQEARSFFKRQRDHERQSRRKTITI